MRFFSCLAFLPQETAGFVFSFKCQLKKKIRVILRRQEFVRGSFPQTPDGLARKVCSSLNWERRGVRGKRLN